MVKFIRLVRSILFGLIVLILAGPVNGNQESKSLTAEQVLKAQVQVLSEQLAETQRMFAQCRADASTVQARYDSMVLTVQNSELKAKHEALESEIKKALGGKDTDEVDWTTTPPSLKKPKS